MDKKYLYHGSVVKDLIVLQPFSKSDNTIKKAVVYLTLNNSLALFYIWNRPYKWVTYEANENEIVVYTEEFPNQLYEFYHGVSGYLYRCDINNQTVVNTHINDVFISEIPVPVLGYDVVEDIYDDIIKREKMGLVQIKRYETLTDEELKSNHTTTIRAIHMQKLLHMVSEQSAFIKEKFPLEWEQALNDEKLNGGPIRYVYENYCWTKK